MKPRLILPRGSRPPTVQRAKRWTASAGCMSDADTPAEGGDELMSPHELLEELDTDGSGWIEFDEFEKRDSIDKELDKIRVRRSADSRRFPRGIEDFVLIGGVIYGILFFGGTLAMSAGMLGDTVVMDEALSDTFLDFENCTDPGDEVWINAWIDDLHNIRIDAMNVPLEAEYTTIGYNIGQGMNASLDNSTTIKIDFTEHRHVSTCGHRSFYEMVVGLDANLRHPFRFILQFRDIANDLFGQSTVEANGMVLGIVETEAIVTDRVTGIRFVSHTIASINLYTQPFIALFFNGHGQIRSSGPNQSTLD